MKLTRYFNDLAPALFIFVLFGCAVPGAVQPDVSVDDLSLQKVSDKQAFGSLPGFDRAAARSSDSSDFVKLTFVEMSNGTIERRLVGIRLLDDSKQWMYFSPSQHVAAETLTLLGQAKRASEYHQPLKITVGEQSYWVVRDTYCFPDKPDTVEEWDGHSAIPHSCLEHAELYSREPDFISPPTGIIALSSSETSAQGVAKKIDRTSDVFLLGGEIHQLGGVAESSTGAFTRFELKRWRPDVPALLQSHEQSERETGRLSGGAVLGYETAINDAMIEWKVKDMIKFLQAMNADSIRALQIDIEKLLLRLDTRSRNLKDAVDQDAQKLTQNAPARALEVAHTLDQRRTILTAILSTVREAARAKSGEN